MTSATGASWLVVHLLASYRPSATFIGARTKKAEQPPTGVSGAITRGTVPWRKRGIPAPTPRRQLSQQTVSRNPFPGRPERVRQRGWAVGEDVVGGAGAGLVGVFGGVRRHR